MKKIAVIQFPGTNCEQETAGAVNRAGMSARIFRWNKNPAQLSKFDGFIIPGGFSYQDRVRAGAIAAKKRITAVLFQEALDGKPLLGICNGAQVLIEGGILPGIEPGRVEMALAPNTGRVGYYCNWVYLSASKSPERCAFTNALVPGEVIPLPVAHAEGRFTTRDKNLVEKLKEGNQIVLRYTTASGKIKREFPVNPNGSLENIAGLCNPAGNVLALMPHPERAVFRRQVPDDLPGRYGKDRQACVGNADAMSAPVGPGMKFFQGLFNFLEGRNHA